MKTNTKKIYFGESQKTRGKKLPKKSTVKCCIARIPSAHDLEKRPVACPTREISPQTYSQIKS